MLGVDGEDLNTSAGFILMKLRQQFSSGSENEPLEGFYGKKVSLWR